MTNAPGSVTVALSGTTGTVTSVGLSLLPPSIFSISGTPVTTVGTLTGTLANQNANIVLAGPASGAASAPTFRSLQIADISGALNNQYVFSSATTTGFSSTSTVSAGLASTPAAGTYFISFNTNVEKSDTTSCEIMIAICKNGIADTFGLRWINASGRLQVSTQVVLTLNGSDQITACWARTLGACTFSMYYRNLVLLRIAP